MLTRARELWLAFFAILFITLVYLLMMAVMGGTPAASGFYGHAIGILGFLLMLMTETLYSFRKRSRSARWGRMAGWLEFHIFTGLVGPYMVLLHSSWKFNGIAGVLMLFTVVIVISGVIGRYIYTEVPRTADGIEIESTELDQQIAELEAQLSRAQSTSELTSDGILMAATAGVGGSLGAPEVSPTATLNAKQIETLTRRSKRLKRQVASLASARKALALWHSVHIPIGLALFCLAFVHVAGAIYYALLAR